MRNITQGDDSEREVRPLRQSQRQEILDRLIEGYPGEVPAHVLARISLQYSARLFELRAQGYSIISRVVVENGKKHGFFRLASLEIQLNLFGKVAQ